MIRLRPRASALLVLLLAAGCATVVAPPREPIAPEARRALDLLRDRWLAFDDLRTLTDLRAERHGERIHLAGVLLVRRPGSVRFEALAPFGPPLFLATVHGGELRSYSVATNEALVGPADAETTARLLSLPVEPQDLVGVLAGLVAPPEDLRAADIHPADEHGLSLELHSPLHRRRVWLDWTTGVVRQQQITGGRYELRVTYDRGEAGELRGFTFTAGEGVVRGRARYRDPVFGAGIDPERFTLIIPEGARVRTLR